MAKRRPSCGRSTKSKQAARASANGRLAWRDLKIIVERHLDGYVAYPLGLRGVVVGQGDSYEAAMTDVRSAIDFHFKTFADEAAALARPD